jgi:hypothetical protein
LGRGDAGYEIQVLDNYNNKTSHIKMAQLEKLCMLLHCTPNDLIEWKAPEKWQQVQQHPLNALVRKDEPHLHVFLKNASVEQLDMVQEFITKMQENTQ